MEPEIIMNDEDVSFINEATTQTATVKPEMYMKAILTAENPKDKLSLLKKIHNLHSEMRKLDWTPDGFNKSWNHEYYTAGLVKSNFQKACINAGLIYMLNIESVKVLAPTKGFSVRMGMYAYLDVIDIDTGATISYPALGEAGDSGDKCSSKLMTMTIKSVIATNFAIADIDPERDIADGFGGMEQKQKEAERILREKAQPTTASSRGNIRETVKNSTVESKNTGINEEPKLEKDSEVDTRDMTSVQKNTIKMIYKSVSEHAPADFDLTLFKESCENILKDGNRGTAGEWIKKYRGMMN